MPLVAGLVVGKRWANRIGGRLGTWQFAGFQNLLKIVPHGVV